MAIAFVQKTAQFSAAGAASVTSSTLTTTLGNTGLLTIATFASSGSAPPTITDSLGNVGTVDQSTPDGNTTGRANVGSIPLGIAGAGHSWTINLPASSFCEGNVSEVSGVSATPLDQATGAAAVAPNNNLTVTTGVTTQADEIVVGCLLTNTADTTTHVTDPPTGYTSIGVQSNDTVTIGYEAAYQVVGSTGAQSAGWLWDVVVSGGGAAAAGVVVTYKGGTGLLAPAGGTTSLPTLGPGTYSPPTYGLF